MIAASSSEACQMLGKAAGAFGESEIVAIVVLQQPCAVVHEHERAQTKQYRARRHLCYCLFVCMSRNICI